MQSALEQALEQARQAGATRVCSVRLRVGAVSGVVPEALSFAFEELARDTAADGAELVIDRTAARFWCATCQRELELPDFRVHCPACGGSIGELRGGRELELVSLEVE